MNKIRMANQQPHYPDFNVGQRMMQPSTKRSALILNNQAADSVHFDGKPTKKQSSQTNNTTPPVIQTLFGAPGKNMWWTLGYSVGGVMLLPMPAAATGAFCLAMVHFMSATYQFLSPKLSAEPTISDSGSSTSKSI